jgi:hypothetical protein
MFSPDDNFSFLQSPELEQLILSIPSSFNDGLLPY